MEFVKKFNLNVVEVFEHFISSATPFPFVAQISGTGTGVAETTADSSTIGILRAQTGGTPSGRAGMGTGVQAFFVGAGRTLISEWNVRIPTLSTSLQRFSYRVGFIDTYTGDQVDGMYFEYDESLSANWRVKVAANSVRQVSDGSSPVAVVANTFVKLRIEQDGTEARFYINGTLLHTHTSGLPSGTARAFGAGFTIVKSVGTTASNADIDYAYIKATL